MNFEQVIALVNAGYTKAEIEAMQGAMPEQPETAPAENPEPEPAPETTQGATEQQTQQPANNAQDDPYTRLEAKLNQLIGLQQGMNINANIGNAAPERSSTDILGSVIAPPRKERK